MDIKKPAINYSASVDIWLDCGELGIVPLSQASSTFVIAAEAVSLPICEARIIMTIDGERYERRVQLINGMSSTCREAMVLAHDGVSPF